MRRWSVLLVALAGANCGPLDQVKVRDRKGPDYGALVDGKSSETPHPDLNDLRALQVNEEPPTLIVGNLVAPPSAGETVVFGPDMAPTIFRPEWTSAEDVVNVTPEAVQTFDLRFWVVQEPNVDVPEHAPEDCPLSLSLAGLGWSSTDLARNLCGEMAASQILLNELFRSQRAGFEVARVSRHFLTESGAPGWTPKEFSCVAGKREPYMDRLVAGAADAWASCTPKRVVDVLIVNHLSARGLHCPFLADVAPPSMSVAKSCAPRYSAPGAGIDPTTQAWPYHRRVIAVRPDGLTTTLLHEMGHAFGLDHTDLKGSGPCPGPGFPTGPNVMNPGLCRENLLTAGQGHRMHFHPRSGAQGDMGLRNSLTRVCPEDFVGSPICPRIDAELGSLP